MKLLHVAAATLNQTPLDWEGNKRNILAAIAEARVRGVSVLCLPELCITGYGCEDAFHSAATHATAWEVLQEILPATRGMIVSLGLPIFHRNALFNTAGLVVDGRIVGFVGKQFLAGDGIHYEPRWFKPWPSGLQSTIERNGRSCPIGDLCFDCGDIRIGFEICEDAWVAARPGANLARQSVDLLLNPSASHFAFGKIEVRRRFVAEGSRAFGLTYVYANMVGNESGRAIFDGGALIATGGRLVAEGNRFSFADCEVTSAVVDLERTRMGQARTGSFQPDLQSSESGCVRCDFDFPVPAIADNGASRAAWEESPQIKEEEFTRAIVLGLFDYLRKSRSHGFVVSLSGGADSAAVTILAALTARLGLVSLGREGFLAKLGYRHDLSELPEAKLVGALVTTVYQGTANSSETTRHAARVVAEAVGVTHCEWEVDGLVAEYTRLVSTAIGRSLTWSTDDIPLQNIQARVRAPGAWMLANLRNALLLATSNRSEAAVGYATMDGDTCGGLSPIAGIDKAFLRQWLAWMEQHGPAETGAIPELHVINAQAPTAELRPQEYHQTDEEDLMPYPILDAIERAAIRDKQKPMDVYLLMRNRFPAYPAGQMAVWVERFFTLWSRNQWKRERYAPSFHVDDENLDPKTWCRFPILSGGFVRELAELRAYVQGESFR
ncbi:NAD+ synthetase [Chthoniobacter flavus Ellin428]|uniref:Glutamine-dependent NAD(+) synthetase n=1 Tax=Chthoniobacter flavus Ellin428 TaxID=497964 RepID=B4CZ86_9BACT|nr:NAD(+) synthase [Chthoniobacter flavus]EDY20777.1 NAD+ synthetase [Chthoniobacter flavus Ellin428]TCO89671.1 NAD+ synthase (glutamine-hydrolysing) [Chthoniobacter flavus]